MNGVERSNDGVNKLKRCPFCGGRVAMNQDDEGYYVSCCEEGCVVMTNGYAEKEAVEKWNNRKPLERVIERLEEKERECRKMKEPVYDLGMHQGLKDAIAILKEEVG